MSAGEIPFHTTNWETVPVTEHKGIIGTAYWKTLQFGDLRMRVVEYTRNYVADHWCEKGHLIYCLEGDMITELADGSKHVLKKGMSYQVSDGLSSHKTSSENGVKLLIVDGGFLSKTG
jgi:hypothetical protein